QGRIAYNQVVESLPLFVVRLVLVAAVVMAFGWQLSQSRGLPVVLVILAVLVLVYAVLTQSTVFGRHVYAIGGNLNAARLSGVRVRFVNFWIMVNMGLLAAVAGVIYSSRTNGAQPGAGNMLELDATAACVIGGAAAAGYTGGAAVRGAVGRITGGLGVALSTAVTSNGMQLMGVPTPTRQVVKRLALLVAVGFGVYRQGGGAATGRGPATSMRL